MADGSYLFHKPPASECRYWVVIKSGYKRLLTSIDGGQALCGTVDDPGGINWA